MPKFTIIMVVYDPLDNFSRVAALPSAIKSINTLKGDYELIFVNNNDKDSCPKTTDFLRSTADDFPGAKLVELSRNIGCGAGFNRGAAYADEHSDMLVFMSCDALVIDPDALQGIADVMKAYPNIGAVHPLSVYEDINECNFSEMWSKEAFEDLVRTFDGGREAFCIDVTNEEKINLLRYVKNNKRTLKYPVMQLPLTFWAVRSHLFRSLNGFNERFVAGYENIDFALRALAKGCPSAILRNSIVYHRRLLFHVLGQSGEKRALLFNALKDGQKTWNDIWKGHPRDLYYEIRFGKNTSTLFINPLRRIRRLLL